MNLFRCKKILSKIFSWITYTHENILMTKICIKHEALFVDSVLPILSYIKNFLRYHLWQKIIRIRLILVQEALILRQCHARNYDS